MRRSQSRKPGVPVSERVVYVRVWCMGRRGRYSQPRTEPLLCTHCGGEVLCVPITTGGRHG